MLNQRQLFLAHVAQTTDFPMLLEIERAEGVYIYDTQGKAYIDLVSGVSVSNVGHRHPSVVKAIQEQLDRYMHLMVYGEYIQSPQVKFADLLTSQLPSTLDSVYFVNSGSEAIEGAIKLAKRYTGRYEIVAFKNAYHGSTHGALSVLGDEYFKNAFRPLVPGVRFMDFNDSSPIEEVITEKTAAVLVEPVQAEAGIRLPKEGFLKRLRDRCNATGTLLIFDEIQTGFGRLGSLFAMKKYGVYPDIFTIAKAMGGGMPIGAFVSSQKIMSVFKNNPILGHITTFGGHPVSCAAAYASLEVLLNKDYIEKASEKGMLFRKYLNHQAIKEIRGEGLFLAIEMGDADLVLRIMKNAVEAGVILDFFLFHDKAFRIAPPLIIDEAQIEDACERLNMVIEQSI